MNQQGSTIRQLRLKKNLSQEFLADKIGISQTAFSKLENGKTQISLKRLQIILTALEVSEDEINDFFNAISNTTPGVNISKDELNSLDKKIIKSFNYLNAKLNN